MQLVIARAATDVEQKALAYGSTLLAEIGRIRADAERLQMESERRQDVRGALRAIHERLAVVELEAKISGQIETGQKNVTINVQTVSPDEALEYARDVLEFFGNDLPKSQPPKIMILVGFVASSLVQGRNPFAPGPTVTQSTDVKAGVSHDRQQAKHSHKPVQTSNQR